MKLHYMGKYNLDESSLPCGKHKPNAVKFKEAEVSAELGKIANITALAIMVVFGIIAMIRIFFDKEANCSFGAFLVGYVLSMLTLFPHELLHGLCFRKDVYVYTNLKHGMLFVVGPEDMSKLRFVFMSLLPNFVFGLVPYVIGMINPQYVFLLVMGTMCIGMGAGDYYNIYNAMTQMPKGSRTYMHGFHSYWYMPEDKYEG